MSVISEKTDPVRVATTAALCVAHGASELDKKIPNWADLIDPEKLSMGDACKCVLGQIGSSSINLDRFGWEGGGPANYWQLLPLLGFKDGAVQGFNEGSIEHREDSIYISYAALKEAWTDEINRRKTGE